MQDKSHKKYKTIKNSNQSLKTTKKQPKNNFSTAFFLA